MAKLIRFLLKSIRAFAIIIATIIVIRGFDARSLPDLSVWHEKRFGSEFRADRDKNVQSLAAYLEQEDAVFAELEDEVYSGADSAGVSNMSRFNATSVYRSQNHARDWNRTTEFVPAQVRGGALLLHGLTDSPYSMRSTAELFLARGYRVLVPRLPGHGTAPAGIMQSHWEDWQAVVEIGARHLQSSVDADLPFIIVGYSNGGALAVNYALDALEDDSLPRPDRLVLMSPAIGLTPFAFFASWNRTLSWIPFFGKFAWESVLPEYDPYKYNSFPKAAGNETYELSQRVQKRLLRLRGGNRVSDFPPMITFVPIVDATVRTDATVDHLYAVLDRPQDELVVYDINRYADMEQFFGSDHADLLRRLQDDSGRRYMLTVVGNVSSDTRQIAMTSSLDSKTTIEHLEIEWPPAIYSLSHVAIPFPPEDAWYGDGRSESREHVSLGRLNPYGERGLLRISPAQIMRLRYNPFYEYQARRIGEMLRSNVEAP